MSQLLLMTYEPSVRTKAVLELTALLTMLEVSQTKADRLVVHLIILQNDNDPIRSKKTNQTVASHDGRAAQSPHLNPVELVW